MKKRILCFGDSNTWGYDAASGGRYPESIRWTKRLQTLLGDNYEIIEEGLCGRTTVFEDPLAPGLSGLSYLGPCLMSHSPIDYLILMLGTNDCAARFSATAKNIADGMRRLLLCSCQTPAWRNQEPAVMIIAPFALDEAQMDSSYLADTGTGISEKSKALVGELRLLAAQTHCDFLDLTSVTQPGSIDHVHLDAAGHKALAEALYAYFIKRK